MEFLMIKDFKAALVLSLISLLSACGGGATDGETSSSGSTTQLRAATQVEAAAFSSSVTAAPADGATLSGLVRLQVQGADMANVELLPANGYTPQLGIFTVSADKSAAWLDLDTTKIPNGVINVRISAFDTPAGQPGATEIVAMQTRTWNISNTGASASAPFAASLASAPANGAVVSGIARLEVRGSGIVNAELLPASGYSPRLGVFNVSADRTHAWLDFDTRSLPDGVRDLRISAYNRAEGQPNASEIIAMPARRWQFSNGATSAFTATVATAPPHGSTIAGTILFEVRGTGLENVELLPANGYAPRLGVFTVSEDRTYAYLYFYTAGVPDGLLDARISAFSVAAGQPNAREIIAMPARQWKVQQGASPNSSTAEWTVTDLTAAIGQGKQIFVDDLNDAGDIVGTVVLAGGQSPGQMNRQDGFLYKNGTVTHLAPFNGYYNTAIAINNNGDVIGNSAVKGGNEQYAYLYADGTAQDFSAMGGNFLRVTDINNARQIIGNKEGRAILFSNGTNQDLGLLPGTTESFASQINASGMVLGLSHIPGNLESGRSFLYSEGSLKDLSSVSGCTKSSFTALNDAGQLGGTCDGRLIIRTGESLKELGQLPGYADHSIGGINNAGQTVGTAIPPAATTGGGNTAFFYNGTQLIDLNTVPSIAGQGWQLLGASGINNAGQIMAIAVHNGASNSRYVLLTPVKK
jgi:probable HAF family extracellular repeat protein